MELELNSYKAARLSYSVGRVKAARYVPLTLTFVLGFFISIFFFHFSASFPSLGPNQKGHQCAEESVKGRHPLAGLRLHAPAGPLTLAGPLLTHLLHYSKPRTSEHCSLWLL